MGKVICVANQKGGVGKTTTVVNVGASLAYLKKKTLIIDFDPQANATSGLGVDKKQINSTIYYPIIKAKDIKETIIPVFTASLDQNLSLSPSNSDLTGAQVELANLKGREKRLKEAMKPIVDEYEFILIDSPPSLGLLTVNALSAADTVLVPVQCEYYAMEGLSQLQQTITLINSSLNPNLTVEGYLLTMFDQRNNLAHMVVNEMRAYFKDLVFSTIIPRSVRLAESPSHGLPGYFYDRNSVGALSYFSLAKEIIIRSGGKHS
ncbi:MAG: AAA family ATPase [Thermodesulfobacteriota bacterium]